MTVSEPEAIIVELVPVEPVVVEPETPEPILVSSVVDVVIVEF